MIINYNNINSNIKLEKLLNEKYWIVSWCKIKKE